MRFYSLKSVLSLLVLVAGAAAILMLDGAPASASPAPQTAARAAVAATPAGVAMPTTFYGEVLPILQARCQSCHRPGEVAPMSLLTYDDAKRWSRMIKRAVEGRVMPPWPADVGVGVKFHNDRALSDTEIATLVAWVDEGAPAGEGTAVPAPRDYIDGWQINPDMVVELPPFDIPARGVVEYTYYIVPEKFTEDRWVKLSELRPTNREVTHHLIAYIRPPGSSYFRDYPVGEYFVPAPGDRDPLEDESGFRFRQLLGGYAPGSNPGEANFPDDQAEFVEAGSQMVFEVHYNSKGEAATDQPRLGLEFLDGAPDTRRLGGIVIDQEFEIPPHADSHRVDARVELLQDVSLLAMLPHMHLRGKSFEYRAVFPDGRTETLLSVSKYDFNWQLRYYLEEPMLLPAGTVIEGTAYFDNSADNPHNPDPTSPVSWGDQSWEEMMIGFFTISFDPSVDPESIFGER